jgi:hypothetical protein
MTAKKEGPRLRLHIRLVQGKKRRRKQDAERGSLNIQYLLENSQPTKPS